MPVGPFKTFADCVSAQKRKGKSDSSARKICGEIEKRSNQKMTDSQNLIFSVPIKEFLNNDRDDFIIRGIAINETTTRNNITYIADELEKAAHSLIDKPLLKDHNNSVDSVIGIVSESSFDSLNKNIPFTAKVIDTVMQQKIKSGLLKNVSIGATYSELVEEDGKSIVKGLDIVELSLVAVPADPNAGFTKALFEAFKLRKNNNDKKISEEKNMTEEKVLPKVEEKKEEIQTVSKEEFDALKLQFEELKKVKEQEDSKESEDSEEDSKEDKEELTKEKIRDAVKEGLSSLGDEIKKLTIKEDKKEFKGEIVKEKTVSNDWNGFVLEREIGGNKMAFWKEYTNDPNHGRLYRGK